MRNTRGSISSASMSGGSSTSSDSNEGTTTFRFPSFVSNERPASAMNDIMHEQHNDNNNDDESEVIEDMDGQDEGDDYTLESSSLENTPVVAATTGTTTEVTAVGPEHDPVKLVSSDLASTHTSNSIKSKLRKSFTFSLPNTRRATILRKPTFSLPQRTTETSGFDHDVEKFGAASKTDQLHDQAIAEDLVTHYDTNDHRRGFNNDPTTSTSSSHALEQNHNTNPNPYLLKEEFDDEVNRVNDQFSDSTTTQQHNNVQTGILASLLQLYQDSSAMNTALSTSQSTLVVSDSESDSDSSGNSNSSRSDDSSGEESRYSSSSRFADLTTSKSAGELDQLRNRFKRKLLEKKRRADGGGDDRRSRSPMNHFKRHARNTSMNFKNSIGLLSTDSIPTVLKKRDKRKKKKKSKNKKQKTGNEDEDEEDDEDDLELELPQFKRSKKPKQENKHHAILSNKLRVKHKQARAKITVHIVSILHRQKFILKLCKTFMLYGAPTHRLEEYLIATSRVLEIDASFIYIPGCMLISFGDATTRTSEMHLVRCPQGLDLSKLYDVHLIYKKVMHDMISVDDAVEELDQLLARKPLYNNAILIFGYGLSSLFITSWGFKGGWRDMPISFVLGLLVGFLQIVVSPRSNTYSSAFEVSSSILVAFLARAFGSISSGGGSDNVFCFSAIAQSSLVMILPGYTILCGSLELQSRNLVSGTVRMFYAIIYSLFLGFGIILGAALYKWVDHSATTSTSCPSSVEISDYYRFLFVPLFALTQAIIAQARLQQLPVMMFISCASYVGYYFASLHFSSSAEFSAAIGAFLVGILGNLYSRIGQGLAVAAMYPGILLLVPGSIGLKSSLSSGITIADEIVNGETTSSSSDNSLSFGIAMIEVAIGLCVGLIGAAVVIYPFGKKRTGLFTL